MQRNTIKFWALVLFFGLLFSSFGCESLKKKFTRKKKEPVTKVAYFRVKKYDIKPSMELYEKHYVYWINWQRKLTDTLGKNFKSDRRSSEEAIGQLEDMAGILTDEKAELLVPHINEMKAAKAIICKRNLTKANETRIRLIIEREYRVIKRKFAPRKMAGSIREDWRTGGEDLLSDTTMVAEND